MQEKWNNNKTKQVKILLEEMNKLKNIPKTTKRMLNEK